MDLEGIIKKWEDLGLMANLPEDVKANTAINYEKASQILIQDEFLLEIHNNFLTSAIFPIIYRINKSGVKIKNIPDLIENFNQFIMDNRNIIDGDYNHTYIDIEAEMCRIFSEDYIEWITQNPEIDAIKYVPKHKL